MTIQHAHIEVKAFLRFHREEKTKSVRIITGKSGKIKKEFIFWIESEPYIRKIEPIYDSRKQVGSFQIFLKKISKTY
jgi:DNA-nicking Smr family endonuclease